jgi:hypothetical protein
VRLRAADDPRKHANVSLEPTPSFGGVSAPLATTRIRGWCVFNETTTHPRGRRSGHDPARFLRRSQYWSYP